MPVYEYRCKSCGETHEIQHGFNDDRPTKCPTCGGLLIRVFHPIGVVFKGSGFHKTDYGKSGVRVGSAESSGASAADGKPVDNKPGEEKPKSEKPAESKSSEGKSSEGKSSESKPSESKPAASKPAADPKSAKSP
jgi:putative FmdB family regulatory protein